MTYSGWLIGGSGGRRRMLRNLIIGDDSLCFGWLGVFAWRVFTLSVFTLPIFGLRAFLLFFLAGLAGSIP